MDLERWAWRFSWLFLWMGAGLSVVGGLVIGVVAVSGMGDKIETKPSKHLVVTPSLKTAQAKWRQEPIHSLSDTLPSLEQVQKRSKLSQKGMAMGKILTVHSGWLETVHRVQRFDLPLLSKTPLAMERDSLFIFNFMSHVETLSEDMVAEARQLATPQTEPAIPEIMSTEEMIVEQTEIEMISSGCPSVSGGGFQLIPISGPWADRSYRGHGDLNIHLRGFAPTSAASDLIFYSGNTDSDAPQLTGLFQPNRQADITTVYRVNHWLWEGGGCGNPQGCVGEAIGDWEVTMVGLATTPGESISIPKRGAEIYGGGFKALVLYADPEQVTLAYTRHDSVGQGYVVHIDGVCVDPALVTLYQAQNDEHGWRSSGQLPALYNDQPLGTAIGSEIRVAVRDNGTFLDPRSSKDWWRSTPHH